MDTTSSRRNFLARAGAAAGAFAAAFGVPTGALGATRGHRKHVYKLVADGPKYDCSASDEKNHNCAGCNACQSHAKNKLFASKDAAEKESHRAHPGCRCGVKRGRRVSREQWHDLFRPDADENHVVVDKRDPRVRRILSS